MQGNLLPQDKLDAGASLQVHYGFNAMAGDGINDAPALTQEDRGFAMGTPGNHIAIEAADVVIMNDDLMRVPLTIALSLAFLIDVSILVLAARCVYGRFGSTGHGPERSPPAADPDAGHIPAQRAVRVALPAAAQSSTLTATMAAQIVMEGFLQIRLPDWKRRLPTGGLALIPATATVILFGERAATNLLVLSQVVLSLQLPFAMIPLVWFCGRPGLMGELRAPLSLQATGWLCASVIVLINGSLLGAILRGP